MALIYNEVYCEQEHEDAVNTALCDLMQKLDREHPEYGFDVGSNWDECHPGEDLSDEEE